MRTVLMLSRLAFPAALLAVSTFIGTASPAHAGDKPLRQIIDAEISAAWKKEKITPAPRCDDATILRRLYLDLVGTIPSYEETKKFLADTNPTKREKLIDQLLED